MLNATTTEPGRLINRYLALLLIFYLIDAASLFFTISLPFGLIYGPLLFLTVLRGRNDNSYFSPFHIFPFLTFLFVSLLSVYGRLFDVGWAGMVSRFFNAGYAAAVAVSVLFYGFACFVVIKNNTTAMHNKTAQLIIMLYTVTAAGAVAALLSGFVFTVPVFQGLSFICIGYYAVTERYETKVSATVPPSGVAAEVISRRLKECMEGDRLFLDPLLTLDKLAAQLGFTKEELSIFLSSNLGIGYYRFIAGYRIAYAKKRLEEDFSITIEALAYECGFNSKAGLNKYFKEITGMAPSKYRATISKTLIIAL